MRNRQTGVSLSGLIIVFAILIVLALLGMKVGPAFFEFNTAKKIITAIAKEKATAHEEIGRVLAHEDFKIQKMKVRKEKGGETTAGFSGFEKIFEIIGYVIFWAAVAFAVWKLVEFIIRNRHSLKLRPRTDATSTPAARSVMGLDLTPDSLPDDVVRAAREKWEEGDFHGALSLLYRGSLSWLLIHAALPVRDSDTEGDCLRHTQKLPDTPPRGYFEKLTVQWIAAAYGDRAPANEIMRALFNDWPFGTGRKSS